MGCKVHGPRKISIGDIVLLKNDSTSRCYWKLSKVEELINGTDGRIRAAMVKVASNDKRPVYLRRVVQHLVPIEVKAIDEVTHSSQSADRDNRRPRRTTAIVWEMSRREMQHIV